MSALLLVLIAGSPVEALHRADLAGAVLALSQPGAAAAPHSELAADLVRLIQCEPLAPLAEDAADRLPRTLVRAEAARGGRLGAEAGSSKTVWAELLRADRFRRSLDRPRGALSWPDTAERWPDEALQFELAPPCVQPTAAPAPELSVLSLEVIDALRADARLVQPAQRAALHRTALLLREGRREEARQTAERLAPEEAEPKLAPYVRLARLELELDPHEGFLALTAQPLGSLQRRVTARAAGVLVGQRRFAEVLALTSPVVGNGRPAEAVGAPGELAAPTVEGALARDLACRHGTALVGLRNFDAAARFLVPALRAVDDTEDPATACLRELGLEVASRRTADELTGQLVALSGADERLPERWVEAASRAVARRELLIASSLAARTVTTFPGKAQRMAEGLLAELAWIQGDGKAFSERLDAVFGRPAREGARARADREAVAIAVAQSLVGRMASAPSQPALRERLLSALREFHRHALRRNQEAAGAVRLAAEKGARQAARTGQAVPVVALGDIDVPFDPPHPPAPDLPLELPEPYSLLAIPAADGAFHDVFAAPSSEVTDAT